MKQSSLRQFIGDIMTVAAFVIAIVASAALTLGTEAVLEESEQVRAVLLGNVAAFERGDMATLNALWANDDSVTVFEQGHANYGWADYRDNHLGPEMKEMKNTKYALSISR